MKTTPLAVTLASCRAGVEITREQAPEKAAEIESWIDQVGQTWNVLPVDGRIFRTWANSCIGAGPPACRRADRRHGEGPSPCGGHAERARLRDFRSGYLDPFQSS